MEPVKGAYRPIRYLGCNPFKGADEGCIAAWTLSRWWRSSFRVSKRLASRQLKPPR